MNSQKKPRVPDAITEEEKNMFKLMKMIYSTARSVLYNIFLWGTEQQTGQSLEDYLLNTKGLSNSEFKRNFDSSQRLKMTDRAFESTYDITLLFKVIRNACRQLETTPEVWNTQDDTRLEWLLTKVKTHRNKVSHAFCEISVDIMTLRASELMEVLEKVLTVAGSLYTQPLVEVQKRIQEMKEDIIHIRDQCLVPSDISRYEVILLNEQLKSILKEEGAKELKERYKTTSQLNPVSFLESMGVLLKVTSVFTQIEVENAGDKAIGSHVPCNEVLKFCRSNAATGSSNDSTSPEVYLLEGPAGAGKTTLLKFIKSEWSNGDGTVLGLDDFDLLLFMECRNQSISSLSQLLSHLMPKTNSKYFGGTDLLKFTLDLNTLVLVDGLDELNSSSEKLYSDIISQTMNNFVVFCTSRPEKVGYFQVHIPPEFHTAHLRIVGIADDRREEFIRKYHSEMLKTGKSAQDTESLVNFVRKTKSRLQSHYRLPLNLVVLAWLWADDPCQVTPVTTSSELYIQTHNLMKKKLVERLVHSEAVESSRTDPQDLERKLKMFLSSMYREALVALRWDAVERFLPESVDKMKATCVANDLPFRETLSAFLVLKSIEGEEKVSIPHKLLHDFYASQWILQNLFQEIKKTEDTALLQQLAFFLKSKNADCTLQLDILSDAKARMEQSIKPPTAGSLRALIEGLHSDDLQSLKMTKYQSVLLQVAGVIYALHGNQVQEWTAEEIVQLLSEAELGKRNNNEWFDLLSLVKSDHIIIKHVSSHIRKAITINEERVEAATILLREARPRKIMVNITSKTKDIPHFQDLMTNIKHCKCKLDLAFWEDFRNPGVLPSNNEEVEAVSQRCRLGEVAGHVSADTLAKIEEGPIFLNLAVASDQEAQKVMLHLQRKEHHSQLVGLSLHLTPGVSPSSLSWAPDIQMLCLVLSGVDDGNLGRVCQVVHTLQPADTMFMDIRLPQAQISFKGWRELLKGLEEAKITALHITIPEEAQLTEGEYEWLKEFSHDHIPVRCALRRYSKEQMWESAFIGSVGGGK